MYSWLCVNGQTGRTWCDAYGHDSSHDTFYGQDLFTDASFREVGVAMSFLLIHRATVAYGLYWEGRSAIGMAGVHARNIVRMACTFANAEDQQLLQATLPHTLMRTPNVSLSILTSTWP